MWGPGAQAPPGLYPLGAEWLLPPGLDGGSPHTVTHGEPGRRAPVEPNTRAVSSRVRSPVGLPARIGACGSSEGRKEPDVVGGTIPSELSSTGRMSGTGGRGWLGPSLGTQGSPCLAAREQCGQGELRVGPLPAAALHPGHCDLSSLETG